MSSVLTLNDMGIVSTLFQTL